MFSFFKKPNPVTPPINPPKTVDRENLLKVAAAKAKMRSEVSKKYAYPIKAPQIMPGVVPKGVTAPVMAMDYSPYASDFGGIASQYPTGGFPGFAYLSQLSTRAEYRAFASSMATEITREWIEFTSKQSDGHNSSEKIKAIEEEFKRLGVRNAIGRAAAHDCYFGRGQIYIDIRGHDKETPLILSPRTVQKGSLNRIANVEPIWTTPSAYNALDPSAADFYRPTSWYMLGQKVHASRMMTIITRELPDMLKPAFNFAGMSLSQLAEPYVDNWLRTRQSVSNLINNFSITGLATSMDQVLQGEDNGTGILARGELFTATRSNSGLMLFDKDREELVQLNTPLGGLDHLQAQAQEHMCSESRIPAMILTGISPSGLNASSEGESRVFYDWISAQQEAFYRAPIETILQVVQLSLFGDIDPDIEVQFVPLYQMTPKELAEIRATDGATSCAYVAAGIIGPGEVRERLAKEQESGYQGLDTEAVIVPPNQAPEGETDPLADLDNA
jgi:phage-related protein (TIGR01555 family)